MPFAQWILVKIPAPVLCLLIVGIFSFLSISFLLIMRSFIPHHRLKQHNDVTGSIFSTVGVLYAVLLAFVVIIVWQDFDKAKLNVQKEVNCLIDLYRDSSAFSPEFRAEVHDLLKDYTTAVIDEEWKAMENGGMSKHVTDIMTKIWSAYGSYLPKNATEQTFFEESVHKMNELGESRRLRLMDANSGVHPILWFVLISGGVVTMSFISFFGAENLKVQMAMALLLAALVGLILFTIASLDYPFTGSVTISSRALKMALACVR